MQGCVTLSVTEAETVALTEGVQDALYVKSVLESIGLQVELPMIVETDNKGAADLANNWSAAGRTRHITTKIAFLRELKEQGIIHVIWIPNARMTTDIFTKNVAGNAFNKHVKTYVGEDEYMDSPEPKMAG